jgi:hypothetical protein
MDRIVQRSRQQLDTLGPGSIGFYTSGQLFCEEYYTLAVIGKAADLTSEEGTQRDGVDRRGVDF